VSSGAPVIQVGGPGTIDPDHNVALECSLEDLERAMDGQWRGALGSRWADTWERSWFEAERVAGSVIAAALVDGPLTEPGVAHAVAEFLPSDGLLVVSSSMPIRDLEWFGGSRAVAHANRGANGIDGVVSTARGLALAGRPVVVLIGDLAFCHDVNALWGVTASGVDVRIVVVDNDGGGIFSFLPQASTLDHDDFERLFGTPHGADVLSLAAGFGVPGRTVSDRDSLRSAMSERGPQVIRVVSDRRRNVDVHRLLNDLVSEALG
jgi:2-succinyl-5-enolpyruvyl-6-hydroxy-3-cyclohexene-1-carboxylate synthase